MHDCGCAYCKELCLEWRIATRGDVTKAIRVLKDNLEDGTIIASSYWPKPVPRAESKHIELLPEEGPWPDVMTYYFQCPRCNQLFELSAETYHGSDGK